MNNQQYVQIAIGVMIGMAFTGVMFAMQPRDINVTITEPVPVEILE